MADKLERAVARARIESALFASTDIVKLGRYHLLEKLGAGGMGVVWGAYDPELDRKVAIKLVRAELQTSRDRILLEGQALAKLSHPNVVAVHDVGVVDEQVYIVMEWVRGQTLRAFVGEPRSVREILAVYIAAGEGLAAAHRAGLVHRDFKPDNAIVGDDGRVRVLDFGLARGAPAPLAEGSTPGDSVTRVAGTPRYMAPEQAAGAEPTPAVDQYALCVSLREALDARMPKWVSAIVLRGTAREPANRYASVDELLRALGRDPARIWRRRLLVTAAIGATATAFVVGALRGAQSRVEPCVGGAAEIAQHWNPAVQTRVQAHLRSLSDYGASEAGRIAPVLDGYRDRWAVAHRQACLARERREVTPDTGERHARCLARSRAALGAVVDVLGAVPAPRLADAVNALHALPEVERCLDPSWTSTVEPPPAAVAAEVARIGDALEGARVRAIAAEPAIATELAALDAAAARVGYLPSVAHAALVHGLAASRTGEHVVALPHYARAVEAALEAGDDVLFVEAFARQVHAFGVASPKRFPATLADPAGAAPLALAVARRLRAAGSFVRPLLLNNLGIARLAMQDHEAARRWFQEALEVWRARPDPAVELAWIPANLALATPEAAAQQRLVDESGARFAAVLGPSHPSALEFRIRAALFLEDATASARQLDVACGELRRLHPHLGAQIATCSYELGWLADERGDVAATRAAFAPLSGADPRARIVGARLRSLDGQHAEASRAARALATELEGSTSWWERVWAADAYLVAALADRVRGARADEATALQRAGALLDALTTAQSQTYHRRRLARIRALAGPAGVP